MVFNNFPFLNNYINTICLQKGIYLEFMMSSSAKYRASSCTSQPYPHPKSHMENVITILKE